jgi:murein DD-endopeptidase MepM/ murein hydrolase activator NlpD
MVKKKYKFNPETLSYERERMSWKDWVQKGVTYLTSSFALALVMTIIFSNFYETPRSKHLKRENKRLLTQYELLSKDLDKIEGVLSDLQQRDDNIYRVIFEADPIPTTVRNAGFGGVNKYSQLEDMDNSKLVIETSKKLDIISKQAYIQSKSYDDVMKMALNKEKMLASIPAIMPISNKDLKRFSSGFGYRMHPIYKVMKMHWGQDFTAKIGTPIYATGDGVVTEAKGSRRSHVGFGMVIKIDHGYGYSTVYGHLSGFNVKTGQKVKRGDVIGYVGNSGGSTAPHLHYEVHKNGHAVDPAYYFFKDLTPQEYEKMIAISSNIGQSLD